MMHSKVNIEDVGLNVSCSWEIANNKRISDTVTLSTGDVKEEKEDLENIVSVDTCVNLVNHGTASSELKLSFTVAKSFQIKKISVISEARVLELYGRCGEYISTVHADFLDECEDMCVYTAHAQLPQPSCECSLKFARLKNKDQMWLYGVHITADVFTPPQSSINFHNVNRILKDSGHQLTEKAEKCKKFLQLYGSYLDPSRAQVKGPDPQILIKMFEAEYLAQNSPLTSKAKSMSRCLTEILPGFTASFRERPGGEDGATAPDVSLAEQVNERMSELERRMTQLVEERLQALERKQNEKLDLILHRLDELRTAMNVRGPEG